MSFWLWIPFIIVVMYLSTFVGNRGEGSGIIGICTNYSLTGEHIIEELAGEKYDNTGLEFVNVPDEDSLRAALLRGGMECGFVFEEDFDKRLEEGNIDGTIRLIMGSFSLRGLLARERVCSLLLRELSPVIIKKVDSEIFYTDDHERLQRILELEDYYIDSPEVFDIEIQRLQVEPDKVQETEISDAPSLIPDRGIGAIFIFLLMFLNHFSSDRDGFRSLISSVDAMRRRKLAFANDVTSAILPGAAAAVYLFVVHREITDVILLFFYIVLSGLWLLLIPPLEKSGVVLVTGLLVCCIILCPVFADLGEFVPAIRLLRLCIPPGLYCSALTLLVG